MSHVAFHIGARALKTGNARPQQKIRRKQAVRRSQVTALIIASALFMENIDSTVIATALPTIAADIGSDPIKLKLALTAYLLSLATFIPISGWMADRFGARLVFRIAIGVFMVGSVLCSLAGSLPEFVLARIVQGAGAAMMSPVGRLVLLRTTPKAQLLSAMAWFTVPALMGPLVGPPLGGFIATYFHWTWIFWINIPVGAIGIVLVTLYIDDVKADGTRPMDFRGFILSGIALSGLVFGFSVIGQNMLPLPISLAMVGTGMIAAAGYIVHARRHPTPILDLTLLKQPAFFTAAVGGFFFRIGVGAIPFLLPLALQLGLGMNPFEAGSMVFFAAVGALAMKFSARPIVQRFGFRTVLICNGILSSCALGAMAMIAYNPPAILLVSVLLVGGFFRSLQFTALNTVVYAEVEERRMSLATSFYAVCQQVSLAAGVAVAAAVVEFQRAMRPGEEIYVTDFVPAFLTVAVISLSAVAFYARMPADVGEEIANRKPAPKTPPAPVVPRSA